jgi:excinuclease ABC subunit A
MDEPTTGLHLEDIRKLQRVFERLLDNGHTLLVIEHNLDVIKLADWIIDLGPEAGDRGGRLVAMGRPEEVAAVDASHTGRWLRTVLPVRARAAPPAHEDDALAHHAAS